MFPLAISTAILAVFNPVMPVGSDVLLFNPARLAYGENRGVGFQVLGVGIRVSNNAFSLSQYNRYTGAFLDEAAKTDILRSIPVRGWQLGSRVSVQSAGFSYGRLAVSNRTDAELEVKLPKEIFDLALNGNEVNRIYSAPNTEARATVIGRTGFGFGTTIGKFFAFGGALHYLRGLFYGQLIQDSVRFITTRRVFAGEGTVGYFTATGGQGWAVDLGLNYRREKWELGIGFLDISPGIVWSEGVDERYWVLKLDSTNLYDLLRDPGRFSYRVIYGVGGPWCALLPLKVNFGVGYQFTERCNFGLLVVPVWELEPVRIKRWGTQLTSEIWLWRWLPVAGTIGYSSERGVIVGVDVGVIRGGWLFSVGVRNDAGFLKGAKGVEFNLGVRYHAAYKRLTKKKEAVLRLSGEDNSW